MSRKRYWYNPESMQFEELRESSSKKFRYIFITVGLLIFAFAGPRVFFKRKFPSPKLLYFSQKNSELKLDYDELNNKIHDAENFLYKIQNRDDKVYRSVFDLEPVPASVREAGFGGSEESHSNLFSRDQEIVENTAQKLDELTTKTRVQSLSLKDIYKIARDNSLLLARKPSIQPISPAVNFRLTSSFGYRPDPFTNQKKMHSGIDLAGPVGSNIYATGEGVVELACYGRQGYGNVVAINHGYGLKTIYAHLNKISVKKGDFVKKGQIVGELGSSGRSTGPHLHYEIREQNQPVNPLFYYVENLTAEEYDKMVAQNCD